MSITNYFAAKTSEEINSRPPKKEKSTDNKVRNLSKRQRSVFSSRVLPEQPKHRRIDEYFLVEKQKPCESISQTRLKTSAEPSNTAQQIHEEKKQAETTRILAKQVLPTEKKTPAAQAYVNVEFLQGVDDHLSTYSSCIDAAEDQVVIASWALQYIPEEIFTSLLNAKRRGVYIAFIVQSIKNESVLNYFPDEDKFYLMETKSHAKFLSVDSTTLVLGSFNALQSSDEETEDVSVLFSGTIKQMWPFYMSIYESYTFMVEEAPAVFGSNASISRYKNLGKNRWLLQRQIGPESRVILLRTLEEHEDFFEKGLASNGDVTICSPFSAKNNALNRLKALDRIVLQPNKIALRVLPHFEQKLAHILDQVPALKSRTRISVSPSHQKVIILGLESICIGSLNWLSAVQDSSHPCSYVELSVLIQGPKAADMIKRLNNWTCSQ